MADFVVKPSKCWGKIKRERLPKEIDLSKIKQAKPTLIDEPLLPSILNIGSPQLSHSHVSHSYDSKHSRKKFTSNSTNLRPSIDSYIINTIKLNQILKNDVPIEQIDFFFQKQNKKSHKKQATDKAQTLHITNDQEARHYMKQFIVIMSLHCGFVGK